MTYTPECIIEAHQALDKLEGQTAAALVQPFIDWLDQLFTFRINVEGVQFAMEVDPAVHERALRLRAVLSEAGELVEAAAMNNVDREGLSMALGVRPFFDHLTLAAEMRATLAVTDAPTQETAAAYRAGWEERQAAEQARRDELARQKRESERVHAEIRANLSRRPSSAAARCGAATRTTDRG